MVKDGRIMYGKFTLAVIVSVFFIVCAISERAVFRLIFFIVTSKRRRFFVLLIVSVVVLIMVISNFFNTF